MASGARGACTGADLRLADDDRSDCGSQRTRCVREFFELSKPRGIFYRKREHYDALVCTGDGKFDSDCQSRLSTTRPEHTFGC